MRLGVALVTALLAAAAALGACSSDSSTPAPAAGVDASSPTEGGAGDDGASPAADAGPRDVYVAPVDPDVLAPMEVRSPAFDDNGEIPILHTCDGGGQSFPLAWSQGPSGTKGYAVVVTDATLGGTDNVHWVVYDVSDYYLLGNAPSTYKGPGTSLQTPSSFATETFGYSPICPPTGTHSYVVTLYAVSERPLSGVTSASTPRDVIAKLEAKKLATATLKGKYLRP